MLALEGPESEPISNQPKDFKEILNFSLRFKTEHLKNLLFLHATRVELEMMMI